MVEDPTVDSKVESPETIVETMAEVEIGVEDTIPTPPEP